MTKRGELSYRQRMVNSAKSATVNLRVYVREIRDLVYFFKSLFGYTEVNIDNFVSFIGHGRTKGCIKKTEFKWKYFKQFNKQTYVSTFVLKLSYSAS